MKGKITKAEARAFKERWKLVNAAERKELRSTPVELKFQQVAVLMASAKHLGWARALAAEETEVRNRWNRLRKALGA